MIYMKSILDTACYSLYKSPLNSLRPSDAYMRRQPRPALVQILACRLFGAKPLPEPMLEYLKWDP